MTSYPNAGGRPEGIGGGADDLGRYASTEELTPNEGVWPTSTEETGAGYEPAAGSAPVTTSAGSGAQSSSGSKADVAKSEVADVKDTALGAGSDVASTAKQEATNVVQEVGSQARGLLDQLRSDVREQGNGQKDRIASTLHSLSKELGSMASKSEENGPVTDLAHQASRKGGEIAHWLENHEPGDVLDEVKRYARRRPFAFLAMCAAAGIVVGRLTRGAVAANTSLDSPDSSASERSLTTGADYPPSTYVASTVPEVSVGPGAPGPQDYGQQAAGLLPPSTGTMNGPGESYRPGTAPQVPGEPIFGQGEYRR